MKNEIYLVRDRNSQKIVVTGTFDVCKAFIDGVYSASKSKASKYAIEKQADSITTSTTVLDI